jgi:hypothetical protein
MTRTVNPILTGWGTVAVTLVLLGVSVMAWGIDDRMLNGVSVWAKPMKFNLSFALHLATLMVFVSLLRRDVQDRGWMRWTLILTSAAVFLELLYIFAQAARGRASHFNFETQWETVAYYGLMGGAAVVVMIGTLIVGLAAWRGAREDIGPGLRTGIVLGAVVGTIATFDLRVSHFFATHLLQALPILGWFADRTLPRLAPLTVWAGTAAGVAIVWLTFTQALAARPFLSLAGL